MSLAAENAEVLESIAARGTDLSIPRMVDFDHLLYSEPAASQFKEAAENAGYRVRIGPFAAAELDGQEGIWDVVASAKILPPKDVIAAFHVNQTKTRFFDTRHDRLRLRHGVRPPFNLPSSRASGCKR